MAASPVDIIIFAPLAPILGVLLFWFIQLLFIESQKYMLSQINKNHEPFCRFTNFIGIFFQTVCHALGYTVTNHGISDFYVSVHYGKVAPKKKRTGVFEWLSNGFLFLGPFFIPPFLLLICLFFLIDNGFILDPIETFTFSENLIVFGSNLYHFSSAFFSFIVTIDLMHPGHIGFFLLFILLGLGIRPSYIKEKTLKKVDIFYDLKNIRYNILHKPIYLIFFLLFAYIFSYLAVLFQLNWYVGVFSILGWVSIIAISALLLAHIILLFIKATDLIPGVYRYLSIFAFPVLYVLLRILFFLVPIPYIATISLFCSLGLTMTLVLLLLHRMTNTFKSNEPMNLRKKSK
jgi:hypothetical protein